MIMKYGEFNIKDNVLKLITYTIKYKSYLILIFKKHLIIKAKT